MPLDHEQRFHYEKEATLGYLNTLAEGTLLEVKSPDGRTKQVMTVERLREAIRRLRTPEETDPLDRFVVRVLSDKEAGEPVSLPPPL